MCYDSSDTCKACDPCLHRCHEFRSLISVDMNTTVTQQTIEPKAPMGRCIQFTVAALRDCDGDLRSFVPDIVDFEGYQSWKKCTVE